MERSFKSWPLLQAILPLTNKDRDDDNIVGFIVQNVEQHDQGLEDIEED